MKIAFVPIDNRPVCYTLPKIIASIDKSIDFYLPDRSLLGDLDKSADIKNLYNWLNDLPKLDVIIISLDTLTYGGLIPSRRCDDSFEKIKNRIEKLKSILQSKESKIYAVSSIMRISNNYCNEEEKLYWSLYGKDIFEYSYNLDKFGHAVANVPQEIMEDYLSTRKRNFEINKIFLDWKKEGLFNTLIFSKDDCAPFGLNVKEARELEQLGGYTKTGADEIPLSLLSKSLEKSLKICPIFIEPNEKGLISNYEDVSVENSVKGQIELAGCDISQKEEADILLYINNFIGHQGEIVMKQPTQMFDGQFKSPNKYYMVADVRFANGADNNFIQELFKNNLAESNFYGYSAWNTTANTLGSLICGAKMKFLAEKYKNYNKEGFEKLQITRFLDDWAYQANVRQELTEPNTDDLRLKIKKYEKDVSRVLQTDIDVSYKYPWNRLFEVEIEFN